ncbi:MarR family winged helix-turn-helix transcriptional regulator [Nocardia bhagyanarayanae]|uniref:DNA-binding MarR family transcriptional regulator n=1 Tax=Nocardia bhagyanarayanae TaxID=1215925 RepID=A0A543FE46_9NOCA|nr:MarR family transcriptional regulator [Nocardia bhagyanarayanae]TQM32022.1 DNA-binding MarR family transcriptional regulator [Nocardia bhagyanarayanae]
MAIDETPARLRTKPSWLISKVSARAHRLIAEAMADAGGRAYHFAILAALDEFGPGSQAQIGQRCAIDQSDMHTMVSELAEQGHVERLPDPSDRRRNLITLTPGGRRRLDELDTALSAVQAELFHALSAAERDHLTLLLARALD